MYIYIHIPFCNNICKYCDFPKMLYDKKFINKYLTSLENEIKTRYKNEKVKTIFIGGGTPTSLDYNELKKLLSITKIFNKSDSIEFTIESNIESLDKEKIKLLREYGVNRVSLGVQSFNDDILKELYKGYSKLSTLDQSKLKMAYLQTTMAVFELIKLDHEVKNGQIKVKEVSGMRKDRYSSIAYNYWCMCQLELKLKPKKNTSNIYDQVFKIRQPKRSKRF